MCIESVQNLRATDKNGTGSKEQKGDTTDAVRPTIDYNMFE